MRLSMAWLLSVVGLWAGSVSAANFAPIASASANPQEAWTNQAIAFSSAGSMDPDSSPQPLSFFWDLGDGTTSTAANPVHAYPAPRGYRVTLTVSDGADTAMVSIDLFILAPPTAGLPTRSDPLALAPGEAELWIANPDSGSVTVLNCSNPTPLKVAEIAVGPNPRTLAFSLTGTSVYVACQGSHEVVEISVTTRAILRRQRVGHQPYSVAVAPVRGWVLVGNQGSGTVSILNADLSFRKAVPVAEGPRALAVSFDGARAYVSHFLTRGAQGTVTEINLANSTVARTIGLVEDPGPDSSSSGKGFPNLLGALAVDPAGRSVWVGGLKSNTGTGRFLNGADLTPVNRTRGLLARIDLAGGAEELARRIDPDDADSISASAFSPSGRYAYVTHQGAGTLSVYDLPKATFTILGDGAAIPFETRLDLGHAPQGIVVTANGQKAYVANYLSRDVTALDLSNPRVPLVAATVAVTAEPLPTAVARGKQLFYRSRGPVHSKEHYIACASCHADGGMSDGRTWDFTQAGEGLRNTTDLRGKGGLDHGPVHWSANFNEIQDFENDIVHGFGGTGLAQDGAGPNPSLGAPNAGRSADLDALAAYVAALKAPPRSPFRQPDGILSDATRRGKAVFYDARLGCVRCHSGARFTDSVLTPNPAAFLLHDVGTLTAASGGRLGGPLPGLDTPSLLGLWDTAPYLHDGSAATLLDVLTTKNPQDRHGVTSILSPQERTDLVEFMRSLDGSAAETRLPVSDFNADGKADILLRHPSTGSVYLWLMN